MFFLRLAYISLPMYVSPDLFILSLQLQMGAVSHMYLLLLVYSLYMNAKTNSGVSIFRLAYISLPSNVGQPCTF
jgi:hypothetical protein